MKTKNVILAVIGIFLFLTLTFEAGFLIRDSFFSSKIFHNDTTENKIRVLFIGDSVLGNLLHKTSLAGFIKEKLDRENKNSFIFKQIHMPQTQNVDSQVEAQIKQFRPHVALILTGKNDINLGLSYFKPWMLKLKFLRFLDIAIVHYAGRFNNLATLFYQEDIQEAAVLRSQSKCAEAIPIYENISTHFDFAKIYSNLHDCYMKTKSYQRGIDFFRKAARDSDYVEQLNDFILINQVALTGKFDEINFAERFGRTTKPRTFVKTNLWFYKTANDRKLFRQEFESMPVDSTDKINPRTANYLRNLVSLLKSIDSKPILLQYPLDHLAPLQNALQLTDEIEYIEIRKLLINAPDEVLVSGWEEDMEHLSFVGASYVSDKIIGNILTLTAYGNIKSHTNR